jgi:hypothetical protein
MKSLVIMTLVLSVVLSSSAYAQQPIGGMSCDNQTAAVVIADGQTFALTDLLAAWSSIRGVRVALRDASGGLTLVVDLQPGGPDSGTFHHSFQTPLILQGPGSVVSAGGNCVTVSGTITP